MATPRHLILITNHFPYGTGEAFLENEIGHLVKGFDSVLVIAKEKESDVVRFSAPGFTHYKVNPKSSVWEMAMGFLKALRYTVRIIGYVRTELRFLHQTQKSFSLSIFKAMLHDLGKSLTLSIHIHRYMRHHKFQGKVILYSYWLTSAALATTFVRSNQIEIRRISRGHGGDVYEYRNSLRYLTFRTTLAKELDHIFLVSDDARSHFINQVGFSYTKKTSVSRLGTCFHGTQPSPSVKPILLSCAYLLPVKRIHLIIKSVAMLRTPVQWIHIGDGPLRNVLEQQAKAELELNPHVSYQFTGSLTNPEVIQFYQTHFISLFINTSSAEGIPVTMMEAQSFGIPVIATDVGGVKEIIHEENGILLHKDSSPEVIAMHIHKFLEMNEEAKAGYRRASFQNWKSRYNAETNFPTFVNLISSL